MCSQHTFLQASVNSLQGHSRGMQSGLHPVCEASVPLWLAFRPTGEGGLGGQFEFWLLTTSKPVLFTWCLFLRTIALPQFPSSHVDYNPMVLVHPKDGIKTKAGYNYTLQTLVALHTYNTSNLEQVSKLSLGPLVYFPRIALYMAVTPCTTPCGSFLFFFPSLGLYSCEHNKNVWKWALGFLTRATSSHSPCWASEMQ